jgi:hypothetical protein
MSYSKTKLGFDGAPFLLCGEVVSRLAGWKRGFGGKAVGLSLNATFDAILFVSPTY